MARELIQTRADADTVDALENYADEADISRSEAIRRLLRSGLADKGYPTAAPDGGVIDAIDNLEDQLIAEREAAAEHRRREWERVNTIWTWLAGLGLLVGGIGGAVAAALTTAAAGIMIAGTGLLAACLAGGYVAGRRVVGHE